MEFLNPEQCLNQFELSSNMTAADFGCGAGGWAIPLARKLKDGRVYAIDIQEEALAGLKMKLEAARIRNVRTIKGDLEAGLGSLVQTGLLDLVLMTNLLFQAKNKQGIIEEAKRVLRQGGRVLLVDWKLEAAVGPEQGRIGPDEARKFMEDAGFVFEKEIAAGAYHYGLVFKRA